VKAATARLAVSAVSGMSIWSHGRSQERITSRSPANLASTRDASGAVGGRVSLDVSPDLVHDTEATISHADPTPPTLPSPRARRPIDPGHHAQRSRRHR
jgi:transaldolase